MHFLNQITQICLPTLCALGPLAVAQSPPTFQTGISLVHVDAGVVSQEGRAVDGLAKADFRIYDDGIEQPIVAFSAEEQQLDLILLIDVSGSMRSTVENLTNACHSALRELRAGDRVSLMSFNRQARVIAPFTGNQDVIAGAMNELLNGRFGGGTFIQEGVYAAADHFIAFDHAEQRRRAVLIITDNLGRPTRKESSVIEELWEADAPLSGLVIGNRKSLAGLLHDRRGGIDHLVERTGGEVIHADDVAPAFPEMMHRIRSRYSLYYRLPDGQAGSLRKVSVELSANAQKRHPEAHVSARQGYRMRPRDEHGFPAR